MSRSRSHGTPARIAPLRLCAALAGLLILCACEYLPAVVPPQLPRTLVQTELTTQFTTVPVSQTWVNVPGAVFVAERGLANSVEQRIGLINHTAVEGDNILLLRARAMRGEQQGRFRFTEFVRRVGELPAPFTDLKAGDLLTGEDEIGTYFWAEDRSGANTICVLGLRRMDSGMRQTPGDTNVLDVMLRNCVNTTADEALAPIMASSIGNFPATSLSPTGNSRMLSPLAGPTPQ